ncbi:MAG: hypothetical protein GY895_04985 [Phycisphaera sp.]|nr:hypothetical protein [Phycisphaera sp.]
MLVVITSIAFVLLVLFVLGSMILLATRRNPSQQGRKSLKRNIVKGMLWILICVVLCFLFYVLPMLTLEV